MAVCRVAGRDAPQSLILLRLPRTQSTAAADSLRYRLRERDVIQGGSTDNLPASLSAPRGLAIVDRSADEVWLWLEYPGRSEPKGLSTDAWAGIAP